MLAKIPGHLSALLKISHVFNCSQPSIPSLSRDVLLGILGVVQVLDTAEQGGLYLILRPVKNNESGIPTILLFGGSTNHS